MGLYERSYYQDEDRPEFGPTWNQRSAISIIILANVAVFVFDLFAGNSEQLDRISRWLTLHGTDVYQPWMYWRAITYGFVHDHTNIWHIFWNMFSLWMLGRSVENHYGRAEFFRIYFVSLVVCGFGWLILNFVLAGEEQGSLRLLGASGAVSCVLMLFVLNFPRVTLHVFGVLPIPAWVFGVLLIVGNLLGERGAVPGSRVAYDVHLLGIGFAVLYFLLHWRLDVLATPGRLIDAYQRWRLRRRMRVYQPQNGQSDEDEMDRILMKLHEQGQESLTSSERKFMEEFSKKMRLRRQQTQ